MGCGTSKRSKVYASGQTENDDDFQRPKPCLENTFADGDHLNPPAGFSLTRTGAAVENITAHGAPTLSKNGIADEKRSQSIASPVAAKGDSFKLLDDTKSANPVQAPDIGEKLVLIADEHNPDESPYTAPLSPERSAKPVEAAQTIALESEKTHPPPAPVIEPAATLPASDPRHLDSSGYIPAMVMRADLEGSFQGKLASRPSSCDELSSETPVDTVEDIVQPFEQSRSCLDAAIPLQSPSLSLVITSTTNENVEVAAVKEDSFPGKRDSRKPPLHSRSSSRLKKDDSSSDKPERTGPLPPIYPAPPLMARSASNRVQKSDSKKLSRFADVLAEATPDDNQDKAGSDTVDTENEPSENKEDTDKGRDDSANEEDPASKNFKAMRRRRRSTIVPAGAAAVREKEAEIQDLKRKIQRLTAERNHLVKQVKDDNLDAIVESAKAEAKEECRAEMERLKALVAELQEKEQAAS